MATHNEFGVQAERLAEDHLAALGWTVVERNWRWRHKEIDLIVRRGATIAFVEVRARRSTSHGHPLETIGRRKRRDLAMAARAWIARFARPGDEFRFDAVSVLARAGSLGSGSAEVDHLENAWAVER